MIKLIDILNEARITPMGIGNELTYYLTHGGEEMFFQTKRGIEIMKKILDDTHPNNTMEEDIKEIIDHPLYKSFVNEAYKASSILQPFINKLLQEPLFNKLPYGVEFFLGNNMVDVSGTDDSKLIVGPSIFLEGGSIYTDWDNEEIEIFIDEEIINILSNQGIKFIDVPDDEKIFNALIGD